MGNLLLDDIVYLQGQIAKATSIPKSYLGYTDTIIGESEEDFENKRIEYYGA